jgi:hypothetical protein
MKPRIDATNSTTPVMSSGIVVTKTGVVVMKGVVTQEASPQEVTSQAHGVTNQEGAAMNPRVRITGTWVPVTVPPVVASSPTSLVTGGRA